MSEEAKKIIRHFIIRMPLDMAARPGDYLIIEESTRRIVEISEKLPEHHFKGRGSGARRGGWKRDPARRNYIRKEVLKLLPGTVDEIADCFDYKLLSDRGAVSGVLSEMAREGKVKRRRTNPNTAFSPWFYYLEEKDGEA